MSIFDCPNRTTTNRERGIINACGMIESGVLPDPGGWEDQAATLVRAYPLVMFQVNRWREVAREKARKDAERGR